MTLMPFLILAACNLRQDVSTVIPNSFTPSPEIPSNEPINLGEPYHLRPGDLVLAASPDDIPAIFANDSLFVSAAIGDGEWKDEEEIVGISMNGEARAYPVRLLSLHEIVNDSIGTEPIAVTWCPLCYSALVFSRVVENRELTFGVSGYLFKNNLVMYDHQTNTLWSQLLFQGIRGALNGRRLEVLHGVHTNWGAWKEAYPETTVLSARQMGRTNEVIDPYAAYYSSGAVGLQGESTDQRVSGKTLVIGIQIQGASIAYPFDLVREAGAINGEIGDLAFLLAYDPGLNSVSAFDRSSTSGILQFESGPRAGQIVDDATGSIWDPQTGLALEGELSGERLQRITAPLVFWFAWSALHPETDLVTELIPAD